MAPMEGAAWSGCALYLTCVRQTIVPALAKSRHPVLILDLLPQMTRSGRGVRRAPLPRMKIDYVTSLSILEPWYLTFFSIPPGHDPTMDVAAAAMLPVATSGAFSARRHHLLGDAD